MSDQAEAGGRPKFEPEQEVRFAVVMYGGVSLAIYINGVAQELYRLVRSTAPAYEYAENVKQEGVPPRLYLADAALESSERIYRDLAKRIPTGGDEETVRTRFVVDILSGTSAGGINGVLLARALALQKDFARSADLWREVADIKQLLREEGANKKLEPPPPREPLSLLNGYRLFLEARAAMKKMKTETPEDTWQPAYVEQLDLAVTATDLDGLPLPIRLTHDTAIKERTHRAVLRFMHATEDAIGEYHTDFENFDGRNLELMLGFAARATSSFPFAFEPVLLKDLKDLKLTDEKGSPEPDIELKDFLPQHTRHASRPLDEISFADGGYLDNKPFSYATEALRSRRADLPVERKLVYIEPHPVVDSAAKTRPRADGNRPGVVGNVTAAMSLPRHETIREDVAAVGQRNLAVARLRDLGLQAERATDVGDPLAALQGRPRLTNRDAETALGPAGHAYAAYRTLRVRTVLDALAELRAELCGAEPDGQLWEDTREALRTWIETNHETTHAAFLEDYDAAFQKRRLGFVHDRVNDLVRRKERAIRMVAVADVFLGAGQLDGARAILDSPRDPSEKDERFADVVAALERQSEPLRTLKVGLNQAARELRKAERAPRSRDAAAMLKERYGLFEDVRTGARAAAGDVDEYMEAVKKFYAVPLQALGAGVAAALDAEYEPPLAPWIRDLLELYDKRFEAYDMIMLPLAYPDLGERNPVDIVRISPLDADGIKLAALGKGEDPSTKLAGIRVAHFGGFLDRAWRDNDLLWGRLDAADVIVSTLLDEGDEREAIRQQAQAAILREELLAPAYGGALKQELATELTATGDGADEALVAAFGKAFTRLAPLPPKQVDQLTSRSVRIAGKVLAETPDRPGWLKGPLRALSLFGPGVARVALPTSRGWAKAKQGPGELAKRVRKLWPFGRN